MVSHHFSPPFGEYVLFFPNRRRSKSNVQIRVENWIWRQTKWLPWLFWQFLVLYITFLGWEMMRFALIFVFLNGLKPRLRGTLLDLFLLLFWYYELWHGTIYIYIHTVVLFYFLYFYVLGNIRINLFCIYIYIYYSVFLYLPMDVHVFFVVGTTRLIYIYIYVCFGLKFSCCLPILGAWS